VYTEQVHVRPIPSRVWIMVTPPARWECLTVMLYRINGSTSAQKAGNEVPELIQEVW
jgi:hypothetical protein